jgi:hypothetical protein
MTGFQISIATSILLKITVVNSALASEKGIQESSKISHYKVRLLSSCFLAKRLFKKILIQMRNKAYVLGLTIGVIVSFLALRRIERYWYCLKKFLSFYYYLISRYWSNPFYYLPFPYEDFTGYPQLPTKN